MSDPKSNTQGVVSDENQMSDTVESKIHTATEPARYCRNCNRANPSEARFCYHDGARLERFTITVDPNDIPDNTEEFDLDLSLYEVTPAYPYEEGPPQAIADPFAPEPPMADPFAPEPPMAAVFVPPPPPPSDPFAPEPPMADEFIPPPPPPPDPFAPDPFVPGMSSPGVTNTELGQTGPMPIPDLPQPGLTDTELTNHGPLSVPPSDPFSPNSGQTAIAHPFPTSEPPVPPVDPYESLREACQQTPPDWEDIANLANRLELTGSPIPSEFATKVAEAKHRVAFRDRVQQAVRNQNLAEIAAISNWDLLKNWRSCDELIAQMQTMQQQWKQIEELEGLLQSQAYRSLKTRWQKYADNLAGVSEAATIQQALSDWETWDFAYQQFLTTLNQDDVYESDIVFAWERMEGLGPYADLQVHQPRVDLAYQRVARLKKLSHSLNLEEEDRDVDFAKYWDPNLFRGCSEAQPYEKWHKKVRARLDILKQLVKAISLADKHIGQEIEILRQAKRLPANYSRRLKGRIKKAAFRAKQEHLLEQELKKPSPSDIVLSKLWQTLQAEGIVWKNQQKIQRCRLAVEIHQCLEQVEQISDSLPADEQDKYWIETWKPKLLANCADAEPLKPRFELAAKRMRLWRQLKEALQAKNLAVVYQAAKSPLMKSYPPFLRNKTRIDEYTQEYREIDSFRKLLNAKDPGSFAKGLNYAFVADNEAMLSPHQQEIEQLLYAWLSEEGCLQASDPQFKKMPQPNSLLARWNWKHHNRISYCRVAVDESSFFDTPEEAGDMVMRLEADDHRRNGGGLVVSTFDMKNVYVTVWAIIDLGWLQVCGPALRLGPNKNGKRSFRR